MISSVKIKDFKIEDYDDVVNLWEKEGLPYIAFGRDKQEKIRRSCIVKTWFFLSLRLRFLLLWLRC
ncbi:MAG: hypothetical protein J7L32_03920 [Thermoplasmata archaeon]|nr:hypothetical protein [Thermoplasmata archaeon]